MSQAAANYWLSRCRRGTPPGPGSPCAALIWQAEELERRRIELARIHAQYAAMRMKARRIAQHHPDPAAAGAALAILNEVKE
jgi:hypothetical protein